jgi:DNA ligase-1
MVSPAPSPPFDALARASSALAATRSRLEKQRILVHVLRETPPDDAAAVVGWLVGEPLCGAIGLGPSQLWELERAPAPAEASLSVRDVEDALQGAAAAPHAAKLARAADLFAKLTDVERTFLGRALTGSLRQGSLSGVMLPALAERAARSEADVRRTVMLTGSLPEAARALLGPSAEAPAPSAIRLFHPLAPMLAASAETVEAAVAAGGEMQVEWKVDGLRAQIHKEGARVRVYSRQRGDLTEGCQPILGAVAALPAETLVLDGEVVLVGPDGKARAFQDSFSAIASKEPGGAGGRLRVYLFDCLHKDGRDLFDAPLAVRLDALRAVAPADLLVPSARVTDAAAARRFYDDAIAAGSEGVVVKDLASPYRFGARGRAWQKVKEFATVDLVVLAVEQGSGRRKGYLSNIHLGARREDGSFCMVGKTFKGMTDEILRWQTARFEEIATERSGHVVHVRPEVVVEVRFNDVQRSPRYPGGVALRFARVVRYREDKSPSEVEPLASLVARAPRTGDAAPAPEGESQAPKKRQLSLFDD